MSQSLLSEVVPDTDGHQSAGVAHCFHCGECCRDDRFKSGEKSFCCAGCQAVFELLLENGLEEFYAFDGTAGVRVKATAPAEFYRYLDEPAVRQRLVDFSDSQLTRVTFRLPAIHCIACVWLLENLFRLKPGLGACRVNFPRKELALAFETPRVKLSAVAALLASLGYEPELKLSDLELALATALAAIRRGRIRLREHHAPERFFLLGAGPRQRRESAAAFWVREFSLGPSGSHL
jgi:Cu+-exporting ATPase